MFMAPAMRAPFKAEAFKASEARALAKASERKQENEKRSRAWADLVVQIKAACYKGNTSIDVATPDMTNDLKRKLKANGYKVNQCHLPQDPEDMRYYKVSWE